MPQNVYIYDPDVPVPKDVQHVEIPEGITVIKENAFRDCSELQSVVLPDSITEIHDYAFFGCSAIRSLKMPNGITEIGECAFNGCEKLQSVEIPDSVTEIKRSVFASCSELQSVAIPDGVTGIGQYAFSDCQNLQSVTIPDSVTEIDCCAFTGCSALQSITIPHGVTEISYCTFIGCTNLQSVTIPDSVTKISDGAFSCCSSLRFITIPDSVTEIEETAFENCSSLQFLKIPDSVTGIGSLAFSGCSALQLPLQNGVDIAPFINIGGYGANTYDVIKTLVEHRIPLTEDTVRFGIDMEHRGKLLQWIRDYPLFGKIRITPSAKTVDTAVKERLRQIFATQKKTGYCVPKVLDELAITVCACGISAERLTEMFDVGFTKALLRDGIPIVPAETCRCYYDRSVCNTLIQKDKISVMAEAIRFYNNGEHLQCYKHLMDFIISHMDTKADILMYAVDHAAEIPIEAGTTLTQIRQHRMRTRNLAEVTKIETAYEKTVPGFRLSDYPCNIEPVGITYDGMTVRVLDLSDARDIALAARLGDLTDCCQHFEGAGETAMMHGFLNPDAGFWIIAGGDGEVKAQAEIWKADGRTLVFDNIEFANTDSNNAFERINRLRNVIAAWAAESGYENIIMGCGFNELGIDSMKQAPMPKLRLTPEEVFILQKDNDAGISFGNIDEVNCYMQSEEYSPYDFVYTDANERCVYIKKDGVVSDYLMQGYDCALAEKYPLPGDKTEKERGDAVILE